MEVLMQLVVSSLIGATVGVLLTWLVLSSKSKADLADCKLRSEGDVKTSENTATELRARLAEMKSAADEKSEEIASLQLQLRSEGELKAGFQSELKQNRSQLEELSTLREAVSKEKQLRVAAETKLEECLLNLEEQKSILANARGQLTDTFNALSAE